MKTVTGFLAIAVMVCVIACEKAERKSCIVVYGVGTVLAQPDTVTMNISLSKTAETTRQAQDTVSAMVRQTLQILHDAGIEDKDISTASLRFFSEYEWGGQRRELLGQKAEQIITFSVNSANNVSNIIDELILINGIELNQMSFSVKDNAAFYVRSRELAYQKAREKAEQYAQLSGMHIVKTILVSEDGAAPVSPVFNRALNTQMAGGFASDAATGSALPAGELEITSRVLVEFLMK